MSAPNFGILSFGDPRGQGQGTSSDIARTNIIPMAPQQGGNLGGSSISNLLTGLFGPNPLQKANQHLSGKINNPQTQQSPPGLQQALGNDSSAPQNFQQYQQLQQTRPVQPSPQAPPAPTLAGSQTPANLGTNQLSSPSAGQGANAQAMQLLQNFEGYQARPTWDVNAYRAGYGSDTMTDAQGRIMKIQPGMSVSKEDAERDLQRRTAEFANHAASQVGVDTWGKLPPNVQAGLTSVAYNYGSLPKSVTKAVQTGDPSQIASAVRGLARDNHGINASRRNKEANYIEGNSQNTNQQNSSGNTNSGELDW